MNEEEIFYQVIARSPEERPAFLEEACAGDPSLRAAVEALLRANVGATGFLEQPYPAPAVTADESIRELAGFTIGPYKLIEQIGEGGMGTVWMAQQTDPVKRIVALKVIKAGMDSKQVIARFEAERQALALMDHPNIARVLDGGTTDAGRPYFVMDLVKGVPITRYCDEHHLTPRQRLELFLPVCQAVQHAHQKGIIHRDLKPSNVLVAVYDGRPVPKVIDFGVAKAAGQSLTDKTLVTGFGNIVGTLEYMSPEQAEVNQLDIDTRSDIYSLGVLLYELLTGSPPFSRKQLEQAGMLEMLRVIREQEPSKPSTKLSSSEALPTLSANRGTEPAKLTKLVRGELDWIVMKALEKDRNRRYETANGFAADVQRYLADEPVQACPPSAMYRFRKFARRNKVVLAMGSLVSLAILSAAIILAISNVLISRETHQKEIALQEKGAALSEAQANYNEAQKQEKQAKDNAAQAEKQRGIAERNEETAKAQTSLAGRRLYASQMNLAMQAWRAGEVPRVLELLEGQRPGSDAENFRGFEWYYLWRLCNGGRRVYPHGHTDAVLSLAFSPDGTALASAGWDGMVRVWDPTTGTERLALRALNPWLVSYSADGKTLAAGGSENASLILWDATTGLPIHTISESVHGLAFSPDNRTIAGGGLSSRFWDVASGTKRATIPEPGRLIGFLPDGKTVVTLADQHTPRGEVRIWDAESGKRRLTIPLVGLNSAVLSRDGKLLATSALGNGVYVWDTDTGKQLRAIQDPQVVRGLAFSPDGKRLATGGEMRIVAVWDVETGRRLVQDTHLDTIWDVAFSPDGKTLASSTLAGAIRLWDMTPAEEATTLPIWSTALRFSADGKTLLVGNSGPTKIIDVATGKELAVLPASNVMTISGDLNVLAGPAGADRSTVWDVQVGRATASVPVPHPTEIRPSLTLAPDGKSLAVSNAWRGDNTVKLWEVGTQQAKTLRGDPPQNGLSVLCAEFSTDGKLLAAGFQFQWVTVWDVATGKVKLQFAQQPAMMNVISLAFSPDNKALAVGTDLGMVTLWDVGTGKQLATFKGHTTPVNALAFSPDGKELATACHDHTVRLWDVLTGQERSTLIGHKGIVNLVQFSPDGNTLATASADGTVKLWRAATGPEALARADAVAIAARRKAVELDPQSAAAHNNLGFALQAQGKLDEAIAEYREAIRFKPDYSVAHHNLGFALQGQGKLDEAIACYREAIGLEPDNAEMRNRLGNALWKQGKLDEAIAEYRQAIKRKPDFAAPHYNLGVVLKERGKLDQAIVAFERVIELEPNHALRHNQLAWLLATCPEAKFRDAKRAVELAKRAVELKRQEGNYWNTLGVAHYRAGSWKEAVAILEKSMELRKGGDGFDWFFLAMAHWKLGEKDKAREWYDRAVQWMDKNQPTNDELRRFRTEASELLELEVKK
jgi:WD40 repeat protein/serine/threonine protein kinase/tetratricopeptide (TPR) repeat protein